MKVSGPGASKGVNKNNKKSDDSNSGNTEFSNLMAGGTPPPAAATNAQSIAKLDSLLAIQNVEDPTARKSKQRMRRRADNILTLLDNIRMKMLGGTLTVGDMIDVADVVASHREKIDDPALTDIMDEVDLRAQVELAKMRVVLDHEKTKHEKQA